MKVFNLAEELEKERKKNKELTNEIKEQKALVSFLRDVIEAKQNRINKAINYIEENCYDEERKMVINELYNEIPELLDILKGE